MTHKLIARGTAPFNMACRARVEIPLVYSPEELQVPLITEAAALG